MWDIEIKISKEEYRDYREFTCVFKDGKLQSWKESKEDWIEHVNK